MVGRVRVMPCLLFVKGYEQKQGQGLVGRETRDIKNVSQLSSTLVSSPGPPSTLQGASGNETTHALWVGKYYNPNHLNCLCCSSPPFHYYALMSVYPLSLRSNIRSTVIVKHTKYILWLCILWLCINKYMWLPWQHTTLGKQIPQCVSRCVHSSTYSRRQYIGCVHIRVLAHRDQTMSRTAVYTREALSSTTSLQKPNEKKKSKLAKVCLSSE